MKTIKPFLLTIFLFITSMNLSFAQDRKKALETLIKQSDIIFEGQLIRKGKSYNSPLRGTETIYYLRKSLDLLGNIKSDSITVVLPGGDVDGFSGYPAHGYFRIDNSPQLLFCKKQEDDKYTVYLMADISNPQNILAEVDYRVYYRKLDELYNDFQEITKKKLLNTPQKKVQTF